MPPTFALGTSRESCDFAARHHLGLGMSFAPIDAISRVSQYYREQCALYGWQPTSDQIIYRGHILLAETDAEAQEALQRRHELGEVTFPMRPAVRDALGQFDSRNIAGVSRPVFRDGPLHRNPRARHQQRDQRQREQMPGSNQAQFLVIFHVYPNSGYPRAGDFRSRRPRLFISAAGGFYLPRAGDYSAASRHCRRRGRGILLRCLLCLDEGP